ncbi:MAG: hypothetical protein GVY11_03250 [Gammaproteobacteria bacterium]|jgi:hypothetical protein|nr:hypothetical protein [Gammaproteobacteria bacterium]
MKAVAPFIRVLLVAAVLGSGFPGPVFAGSHDASASQAISSANDEAPSGGHCAGSSDAHADTAVTERTTHDCCDFESGCPHGGSDCSCLAVAPAVPMSAMLDTLRSTPAFVTDLRTAPPRHVVNTFLRPPRA